ncbi:glycoside hydrolase family 9 protein [Flavobacterium sp. NRK F10]|uniref:glycoside hydrolase family 9 protein n=1 Tax=Flavobacterium sp. NRK F10 TaxID=2954931 RepID=UPI00209009DB|nr:glycoside hydrolase family 9 protein [Flavobacterium sp. NRK F10]MCO6176406.1 glycoside hydrolase family 9 protein [Flavobacterium sp. NRK F10]
MKKIIYLLAIISHLSIAQTSPFIHVDQFGYRPSHTKVAVISNPIEGFNANESFSPNSVLQVKNTTTQAVVFSANIQLWNNGMLHAQSGDQGWWFDFSAVTQAGEYYIYDPLNNVSSAVFTISENVYDPVLQAAFKMFYYNRCGIEKVSPYAATGFTDAISFTQDTYSRDVYDQGNTATEKDMSGGWFDAGDYNKYVTFAENPIHDLLWAYQENPLLFGDNMNIPESGNGIPDILDEIKWELDWLLKMVNTDGSVHIKIGSKSYSENLFAPPSANTDLRYYTPVCTSSTIAAAAMLAHSAIVFEQIPSLSTYTQTLENKAISCWNWVLPHLNNNTLYENCDDGSVKSGDADKSSQEQYQMALVAAIYLYALTGDTAYNQYIINHIYDAGEIASYDWNNYTIKTSDALLYYTTLSGADSSTVSTIINSANVVASGNWNHNFFFENDTDLYRAFNNDWNYHWGSNNQKSNIGILNYIFSKYGINTSTTTSYNLRAKEQIHYFHGVNPLSLVYLTNMNNLGAEKSLNEMFHTWFSDGTVWDNAQTSTYGPAPGFVTGGANQYYYANTSLSPPYNQPPQKSYLDFNTSSDSSWEISEPAIYYQASYLRLLAQVMSLDENDNVLSTDVVTQEPAKKYVIVPNAVDNEFSIQSKKSEDIMVKIFNINGKSIFEFNTKTNQPIEALFLTKGLYIVQVKDSESTFNLKLIKK